MNGLDNAACWTCPSVTWLLTQRKTIHPSTTAATHTHPANRTAHANPFPFTFPSPFLSFPLIHLSIYQQHPPYPSLPPSLSLFSQSHPPIHSSTQSHPSVHPSNQTTIPLRRRLFTPPFFFFFRKEGIDRSCRMLACVCVFFPVFLGGGAPSFFVLSCRR